MKELGQALAVNLGAQPEDMLHGKGGFWIKAHGFYTVAQARKLTGISAKHRNFQPRISAYGDYATIAMLNGIKGA